MVFTCTLGTFLVMLREMSRHESQTPGSKALDVGQIGTSQITQPYLTNRLPDASCLPFYPYP